MADLNILTVMHRGGVDSLDAAYFCALTDEEIASVRELFWINLQVAHDLSKAESETDYSRIPTRAV
jgi:hypothetical protein